MSDKLIVYFSRTGENSVNGEVKVIEKGYTEIVAEKIRNITNADMFKLEPVEPYPYNYAECVKRANDEGFVDYKYPDFKIDQYNTIFLGFPIWWRSYPRIVATFIKDHDFFGKTIIPFCTNEEGLFGISLSELQSAVKGAIIKQGLGLKGADVDTCDNQVADWLKKVL